MIPREFEGETCVVLGTGPSLQPDQIKQVFDSNARVFTCNNAYMVYPEADVHVACNEDWWEHYWEEDELLRNMPATKYTWIKPISERFDIEYIEADTEAKDLSYDQNLIHLNNGSGCMTLNVAVLYGCTKIILLGHDMTFASDYDGKSKKIGSSPRHFFGEYPEHMQHWPSVKIGLSKPGVIDGLIENYDQMKYSLHQRGIDVVNCSPGTALTTFRRGTLENELK